MQLFLFATLNSTFCRPEQTIILVTLNSIQSRIIERIIKYCCSLPYSGRARVGSGQFFVIPVGFSVGLGSLSLTPRHTERKSNRSDTLVLFVTLFFVTLNSIQSRIVGQIVKGLNNLKPTEFAGDTGSSPV